VLGLRSRKRQKRKLIQRRPHRLRRPDGVLGLRSRKRQK
jgi:hypothetical protein